MAWARIESSMPRHPKVAGLSVHAKWALIEAICWSVSQSTDGAIPGSVPFSMFAPTNTKRVIAELANAGLLEINGAGARIHDFSDYQPNGASYKQLREQARIRKQRERERKGDA